MTDEELNTWRARLRLAGYNPTVAENILYMYLETLGVSVDRFESRSREEIEAYNESIWWNKIYNPERKGLK